MNSIGQQPASSDQHSEPDPSTDVLAPGFYASIIFGANELDPDVRANFEQHIQDASDQLRALGIILTTRCVNLPEEASLLIPSSYPRPESTLTESFENYRWSILAYFGLSQRQEQVLNLISKGLSNPEVGTALGISEETVKTHIFAISARLHLKGKGRGALIAVYNGVSLPEGNIPSQVLREKLAEKFASHSTELASHRQRVIHHFGLSNRQIEVLDLMSLGLDNRQIGDTLGIGEETVKTHLAKLSTIMGVSDRTMKVAIYNGLNSL